MASLRCEYHPCSGTVVTVQTGKPQSSIKSKDKLELGNKSKPKPEAKLSKMKGSSEDNGLQLNQWLRFHAPCAGGPGSVPGQGTRSHMPQ